MVAHAAAGLYRSWGVCGLHDLGRFPREELLLGTVSFAVLLAGTFRGIAARLVRADALVVAGVAAVFAGALDPSVSRPVPADVLLLPRGLLQGILGGPSLMRGRGAAKILSGRAPFPFDSF